MKSKYIYTKSFSSFLLFVFISTSVFSQSKLQRAREYKENYQFANAIELYSEVYKNKTPKSDDDIRDIAHCYIMVNDIETAQEWLSKINSFSVYSADDVINYALALKSSGKYPEAINQYKRYQELFPKRAEKVPEWIKQCEISEQWFRNPLPYDVKNVEAINTENSEFGLIPYSNGYIYSSDRILSNKVYTDKDMYGWTGNPYLKLFNFTDIDDEYASDDSEIMKRINTEFHNGPGVFDKKHDVLYFTITKSLKDKTKVKTNNDPTDWESYDNKKERWVNRLDIYYSKLIDGQWSSPYHFQYNNAENYSVGHPAISQDGNTLYFSSDMPGGFGGSDIYYCERTEDGKWTKPVNAGEMINTEGKEGFPYIDSNGNLFFSSDGHPGMGGLDIFKSTGSKDSWTKPQNLKYPINSPKDDFSLYMKDNDIEGYFSSNRDGGKGEDDIYYFSRNIVIVGVTKTEVDGKLVPLDNVDISIENKLNSKSDSYTTGTTGEFLKISRCGVGYNIKGDKDGYFVSSKTIEADCQPDVDTLFVDLVFEKMQVNKTYTVENIYYDYNKWNIRSDAAIELDKLVKVLEENPEIDIELGSHTDSRGSFKYNEKLSQNRAESAVKYIISRGIDQSRITAKGYGEYQLINTCSDGKDCSEEAHQQNRRTEFKVTNIRSN